MWHRPLFRAIGLWLLAMSLAGCGFHLRKSVSLPVRLQATAIEGVNEYGNLDLALKRVFSQAGYPLINKEQASTLLVIGRDKVKRRVLSVNNTGVANEYELQYTVSFKLQDQQQQVLLEEQTLVFYRSYRFDPNVLLAKTTEEQRLKKDMAEQAARQIVRRISASLK